MNESALPLYRFQFGNAEFDEQRHELRVAGLPVEIQRRPLELLSCLLAHAGEVVTKEELLDRVWEGRPTVENVIANAVAKLRAALGESNATRIVTLPRMGYRFDGPLERTALGRIPVSRLDLSSGAAVPGRPNFLLERLLSQASGSNEVWLAQHAKTREHRVYKFSPDGTHLATLKREATISRLLRESLGERPDFAAVMDWNFESPPFFLECEYGGENLQQWADSEDRLRGLTLAERLALFLQIAEAVSAAHGIGVLHRDLKPTNILVARRSDGGWQMRLTDFGSSRLLEPDRLAELGMTRLGLTLTTSSVGESSGTPLYLAPELIGGAPPTVVSDVFALGTMLYQFAIGDLRRPIAPGWERGIENELLREDIAAATDGDPSQRLPSAGELARRLRNIAAREDARKHEIATLQEARETAQSLQRSRARRPWMIAAMLLLASGLSVSLWLYQGARRANARSDAINDFLYKDVLSNTGALKTDSDPDPTMRRVLHEAGTKVHERFPQDPASEGWIRMAIGEGLAGLGDYAEGELQQRQAVTLLKGDPNRRLIAGYALAMTLLEQSKFADAEAALGDIDQLTDTSLRDTEVAMKSYGLRGMLRATRKECATALSDLTAAAAVQLPDSEEYRYNRFNLRSWRGETLLCLDRPAEAAEAYNHLLADESQFKAAGPALLGYARLGRAKALQRLGQVAQAKEELARSLSILQDGVGDSDSFTMGQAWVEAGGLHFDIGELDVASDYLQRGRKLLLEVGEQQEKALNALRLLGMIDNVRGDKQAAIDKLTAARKGLVTVFGETNPDVQAADYWLASVFADLGRFDEAAKAVATLSPLALQASMGSGEWVSRLETLRKRIELRRL